MISKLLQDLKARFLSELNKESEQFNFRINYALNKLAEKQSLFAVDPELKMKQHGVGANDLDTPSKLEAETVVV
jgi:hypothetical protein